MIVPPLLLFALGCAEKSTPEDTASAVSDTGLTLAEEDCEAGSGATSDVSLEATEMPTVLRVRWTAENNSTTWVEFASPDDTILRTPPQSGAGTHEALLLGLPQDEEVAWRVAEDDGDTVWCGETAYTQTGKLVGRMPDLSLELVDEDAESTGYFAVPVLTEEVSYASVLNRAGHYVWSMPIDIVPPETGEDASAPVVRIHPSRDGGSLLFNTPTFAEDGYATLYRVSLDGSTVETTPVQGGHVDFTELPDGTVLMLGWDVQTFGERTLVGDTLIAIQPDGSTEVVWNAFDAIELNLEKTYETGYYQPDPAAEFWTHINGVRYEEDQDLLVMTMTLGNSVLALDPETFEIQWILSEGAGEFSILEGDYPGPLMNHPHSAMLVGGDVLVFSRGDPEDTSICAEASQIALDTDAGTAEKVWRWQPDDCLIVTYLGNADRLDNGNTLVNFASLGQIDEVEPDGDLVRQLNTDLGGAFGFTAFLPTLYFGG